jgi:gamma-tubulin complex component 5
LNVDVLLILTDKSQVDAQERWSDFHFLNSAFQDIVAAHKDSGIDAKLVKFSCQPGRERNPELTVRAFDGLSVEYGVRALAGH